MMDRTRTIGLILLLSTSVTIPRAEEVGPPRCTKSNKDKLCRCDCGDVPAGCIIGATKTGGSKTIPGVCQDKTGCYAMQCNNSMTEHGCIESLSEESEKKPDVCQFVTRNTTRLGYAECLMCTCVNADWCNGLLAIATDWTERSKHQNQGGSDGVINQPCVIAVFISVITVRL